jgi:hypothetical protein
MTFQKNNVHYAPSVAQGHKAEAPSGAVQTVVIDGSRSEGNARIVRIEVSNEIHRKSILR